MNKIDLSRLDLNLLVTFEVLMTEGNVTRAATRLGRTQSAISHALARLREQVGDPLLVKTARGMAPTPFAQRLVGEVRPVLRTIQRIVTPPEPFHPASSKRHFRLAIPDFVPALLPKVIGSIQRSAPDVTVEWLAPSMLTLQSVAEGEIDLALVNSANPVPEGVQRQAAGGDQIAVTFARKGHPALANWGRAAWLRWPHIVVHLGERMKGQVDSATDRYKIQRKVGASVSHFSQVPALLAETDLLATMTPLVMGDGIARYGLCFLEPPIDIEPARFSLAWSFRHATDPGNEWLRAIVKTEFDILSTQAQTVVIGGHQRKRRKSKA
ncbi:MAG: LysR family transcriptional regulator [Burkholderiales bacterium]